MFRYKTFIIPDNILQLTENIVEKYDLYNKKKLISNSVKYIKSVFTEYEKKIVDLNFPECEEIGEQAFQNCKSLLKAKFPMCKKNRKQCFSQLYTFSSSGFSIMQRNQISCFPRLYGFTYGKIF